MEVVPPSLCVPARSSDTDYLPVSQRMHYILYLPKVGRLCDHFQVRGLNIKSGGDESDIVPGVGVGGSTQKLR